MKKLISILIISLLLLTGCAKSGEVNNDGLSSFTAYDLNGTQQNEELFNGKKLTMINVWATYCAPCIEEMPSLAALNEKYAAQGFQIVGIVSDVAHYQGSSADKAKSILKSADSNYVNLLPDPSMQSLLQNIIYVPTTIFVDESGNQIGEEYIGAHSLAEWESIILKLLGEAE